jgi:hypothetical protein
LNAENVANQKLIKEIEQNLKKTLQEKSNLKVIFEEQSKKFQLHLIETETKEETLLNEQKKIKFQIEEF